MSSTFLDTSVFIGAYFEEKLIGFIKQGGKVTANVSVVVSADGKTRTVTETGKTPDGKAIRTVMVYDKQ